MKNKGGVLKRLINYLDLNNVGLLEFTFALSPILFGYSFAGLPLSLMMWVLLFVMLFLQGKLSRFKDFRPLKIFVIYWALHEILMMAVDKVNFFGFLATGIYLAAVFALYPNLDMKKMKGSFNWVALIAMAGLLYQWSILTRGGYLHPLEIPGLSMEESRLDSETLRPSSFFMEPASYVAFMVCPLLFALIEKKYIWSVGIILSMFLTTSTTGLVVSFLMLGISVAAAKKMKISTMVIVMLLGVGLFYALTRLDAFQYGIEKVENTEAATNVRLSQGPRVVKTMQAEEYIFGVPYGSPYRYCSQSGRHPDVVYYGEAVFVSTFWYMLLLYGIVGLLLYLNVYYQILKRSRKTLPLIAALGAVLFSSGYNIGVNYIFTLIVLLVVVQNENKQIAIR